MSPRRRKAGNEWMPPRVTRGRSAYELTVGAGPARKVFRLAPLSATRVEVWDEYRTALSVMSGRGDTVADMIHAYQQSEEWNERAVRTRALYRHAYRGVLRDLGGRPATNVSPSDIRRMLDDRGHAGGRSLANTQLSALSAAYRWGIERGWAEANPCRGIRQFPVKPRRRYVGDDEYTRAIGLAGPPLAALMQMALVTGLRPSDLVALRRSDVTDDGLVARTKKTGEALLFEWTPALRKAVADAKAAQLVPSVYLLSIGGKQWERGMLERQWKRMMKQVVEAGGEPFQFRDLRRKSASDHETGEHLGHTSRRVLDKVYRVKPRRVRPLEG